MQYLQYAIIGSTDPDIWNIYGGPDPAGPRAPKSGGSADPADPVVPTPLVCMMHVCVTRFQETRTRADVLRLHGWISINRSPEKQKGVWIGADKKFFLLGV